MDLFNSAAFDLRVNSLLSEWPVPGLAIAVVQNSTVSSKAFGQANLEYGTPVATDTLWDIASCSKSFTAASLALIIDDDVLYPKVEWESTLSSLIPDDFVPGGGCCYKDITIEDVLSHRSGYPRYDFSYFSAPKSTPKSITRNLRNLEPVAPIRSEHIYSNMMYTVASYLVEHLSGLSFADFLHDYIWSPLGMTSTHLQPASAIEAGLKDRIATPYTWFEETRNYKPIELMQVPEAQGAGSIFTSVDDHIKWIKAMVNQEGPISPDIYRSIVRPRILSEPDHDDLKAYESPSLYAAGWEHYYYRGHDIISHSGSAGGFGSFQFFLPKFGFGGVAIGNSMWSTVIGYRLCFELAFNVFDVTPTEWPEWGSIPDRKWFFEQIGEAEKEMARELREELCPGINDPQPQEKPLNAYTGRYWNPGYSEMKVEIQDGKLFINATDRSNAFTLTFEHLCDQTQYVASNYDWYEGDYDEAGAIFRIENDKVVGMGLQLEGDYDDYAWFDKESAWDDAFALYNPLRKQFILAGESDGTKRAKRRRDKRTRLGKEIERLRSFSKFLR